MKVIEKYKNEIENATKEGRKIIACMCNNEVKSLNYEANEIDKIELLDTSSKDGHRIYIRGILYIMAKALNEVYPEALLSVNYQLSSAMFCKIDNMEITDEMITNVKARMQEIINQNLEIRKVVMTKEEAEEFYSNEKTLRGIVQIDNTQKEGVSLYYCEDYFNYFFGVMPVTTAYTDIFDVIKYGDGFLVRYPSAEKPNELTNYKSNKKLLSTLEEYEDIHRVLQIDTLYKLNKEIKEGRTSSVILLSEALHEKKISQIADQIKKQKKVKVVLIAGPSSSGKTTFGKRLAIQLLVNGIKPVNLSLDNYFVNRENTPRDAKGEYDFETIDALDINTFNDNIMRLLRGEEVEIPKFSFETGQRFYDGETLKMSKNNVIIVEGIHGLNPKLTEYLPHESLFKIFISALTVISIDNHNIINPSDNRLIRRMVRDHKYRGYSALDTLKRWESVLSGEQKHITPYQEEADAMFNSALVYELGALKQQAVPLLEEVLVKYPEHSKATRLLKFFSYVQAVPTREIPPTSILREARRREK